MFGHLKAIEKGSALAVMQKWFTSHFVDPKIADTRASQKLESASQHRHPQWLAAPCESARTKSVVIWVGGHRCPLP